MSKRYLNRRQKDQVYMIAGAVSMLDDWIDRAEQHGEKATELKYARTYLYKHLDKQFEGMTQQDIVKVVDGLKRREVGFYAKWA